MSNKLKVASITLLGLLVLLFVAGTFAARGVNPPTVEPASQAAPVDCTKSTDEATAKAVVENIRKGFTAAELDNFRKLKNFHVGVTSLKGVVTLTGWVGGKATFNKVVKLAKQTSCVKQVKTKTFSPFQVGGCNDASETDCCGDGSICVAKGGACPLCVQ